MFSFPARVPAGGLAADAACQPVRPTGAALWRPGCRAAGGVAGRLAGWLAGRQVTRLGPLYFECRRTSSRRLPVRPTARLAAMAATSEGQLAAPEVVLLLSCMLGPDLAGARNTVLGGLLYGPNKCTGQ